MRKFIKKVLIYIAGVFILAIGINISKLSQLGISPVSAVPYACELIWGIELGQASLLVFIVFIFLQILLLRKNYRPIQLLQLACTYILAVFLTYTGRDYLLFCLPLPANYLIKLVYLFVSILIIGIGVSLYLITNLVPLPAEGLMRAIIELSRGRYKFSSVKIAVDSILVGISALLSLVFLGELRSVREGTVLSALLVGKVVGFVFEHFKEPIINWIESGEKQLKSD